ncbi:MAG: PilZ domain-containing protein [Planctomycetota bacterium]|nr:MAG: PilZ domain-containing protein [Planctomycetota bacterium]
MVDQERRSSPRKPYQAPVAVMMAAGTLAGETINISQEGILIRGQGHISVVLQLDGVERRGRLVRATPLDAETMAYAIHLDSATESDP